jgi:hypothetical protein
MAVPLAGEQRSRREGLVRVVPLAEDELVGEDGPVDGGAGRECGAQEEGGDILDAGRSCWRGRMEEDAGESLQVGAAAGSVSVLGTEPTTGYSK